MTRWGFVALVFLAVIPAASATQITDEHMHVALQDTDRADVTVTRTYSDISSDQISYLVSSHYDPANLVARDANGLMDCRVDSLDIGKEILCAPAQRDNYTVEISFEADLVQDFNHIKQFSYLKRVLVPTEHYSLQVVFPEGYGTVSNNSYTPTSGTIGSEGRKIFLTWEDENVSIGDTTYYQVRYEKLRVLEQIGSNAIIAALVIALLVVGALAYYFRSKITEEKTIASVFPVLKDDEQEVLQYIIDHEGEVEQREIVSAIDYSKAKISNLLTDLAERNLIEKEKRGRVNVVRLAREVGDL